MEQGLFMNNNELETAAFGMGCFWSPEARFGSLPGVMKTRVGYAGGTTMNPTYRNMGDHTETIEIEFDHSIISYEQVLKQFWSNHYPNRDEYKGRQYISILFYHSEAQARTIQTVKVEMEKQLGETIETEIQPYQMFFQAEDRHQKYYLKRYPKALEQLNDLYPREELLLNSTFAARLNGFVKGFSNQTSLLNEIKTWNISKENSEKLTQRVIAMKW